MCKENIKKPLTLPRDDKEELTQELTFKWCHDGLAVPCLSKGKEERNCSQS